METVQQTTHGNSSPRIVEAFICYRRDDASAAGDWLHQLLDGYVYQDRNSSSCKLKVFFDQAEPGVGNWKANLKPALQSAHALIVVCSHGLATNFSKSGADDWAHREIDWWLGHRGAPPILIDLTEHDRWIPEQIRRQWPDLNRRHVNAEEIPRNSGDRAGDLSEKTRKWLVDTIIESEQATTREDYIRTKKTNTWLRVFSTIAVLACVAAMWGWSQAHLAQRVALRQRDISRNSVTLLTRLFATADPDGDFGEKLTAKQLLKAAPATIKAVKEPISKAHLLVTMGSVYTGIGDIESALNALDEASELFAEARIEDEDQFRLSYALGEVHLYEENIRPALQHLERALALSESEGITPSERASTNVLMGDYYAWSQTPDDAKAQAYYEKALTIDEFTSEDRVAVARDHNRLGNLALDAQRSADARVHFQSAADAVKDLPGEAGKLFTAKYQHDFGAALYEDGAFVQALERFSSSTESFKAVYGEDSIEYGIAENNLARMLLELDKADDAAPRIAHSVEIESAAAGPEFSGLAQARNTHALTLREAGKLDEAEEEFKLALAVAEVNNHPIAAQTLVHLAELDLRRNDLASAKSHLESADKAFHAHKKAEGWRYSLYESALGDMLVRECKLDDAEPFLKQSHETIARRWPAGNLFTRSAVSRQEAFEKANHNPAGCVAAKKR